jgi:hypothetical protein
MWQEIIVVLLVIVAALFIGKRFRNIFKGAGTRDSDCGCGCSSCPQGKGLSSECEPGGEQSTCK